MSLVEQLDMDPDEFVVFLLGMAVGLLLALVLFLVIGTVGGDKVICNPEVCWPAPANEKYKAEIDDDYIEVDEGQETLITSYFVINDQVWYYGQNTDTSDNYWIPATIITALPPAWLPQRPVPSEFNN